MQCLCQVISVTPYVCPMLKRVAVTWQYDRVPHIIVAQQWLPGPFQYSDVIISATVFQVTSVVNCLFNRLFRRTAKSMSKIRVTGLLWGESIGDRWIPLTKGQYRGNSFHLITSSCVNAAHIGATTKQWQIDSVDVARKSLIFKHLRISGWADDII